MQVNAHRRAAKAFAARLSALTKTMKKWETNIKFE